MPDVVLVDMPFAQLFTPSLGLSLLQAGLAEAGIESRIRYENLRFGERIGQPFYSAIAEGERPRLTALAGEWLFSGELSDRGAGDERAYLAEILVAEARERGRPLSPALVRRLLAARAACAPFLDECAGAILAERPKLVGFTSVFQQHTASLALARRLKQRDPAIYTVLGGANCEGAMGAETIARFPFVDAVVSGEGDLVFPDLVRRVLSGRLPDGLPGVWTRRDGAVVAPPAPQATMVRKLDQLPLPDYGDFATQFGRSRLARTWRPSLPFESSRGCWWGEKSHCTFCGLNGATMLYRSKSKDRVLAEIRHLTRTYPGQALLAVDNILDMTHLRDLMPELARLRPRLTLFYETKSNLRKDQLRTLCDAGVRTIQPGIESLSDAVLAVMKKGVSGLQNVQLLKWCAETGVRPLYNLLWGFPGEPEADYARMATWLPLLAHLEPPVMGAPIRLDRFSPNFDRAEALGFCAVLPLAAYRHVYPFAPEALARIAYFFTYGYREPRDVGAYTRPLARAIEQWTRVAAGSALFHAETGDGLWIFDLRPVARHHLFRLDGTDRKLYLACDGVRDVAALARRGEDDVAGIERRLRRLEESGLVLRDGGRCIALSVALGEYAPSGLALARFRRLLRAWGRAAGRRGIVLDADRCAEAAFLPVPCARGENGVRRDFRRRPRPALRPEDFTVDGTGALVIAAPPARVPPQTAGAG